MSPGDGRHLRPVRPAAADRAARVAGGLRRGLPVDPARGDDRRAVGGRRRVRRGGAAARLRDRKSVV